MGTARDSIEQIHSELSGALMEIAIREDDDSEAGSEAIRQALNASIWEAIYTLANHIDDLASSH